MKRKIFRNTMVTLLAIFCLLPLVIMIINSFRGIGNSFSCKQYIYALFQSDVFLRSFWNSFIYTVVIIAFNIPISLLAAYGFSRFNFKGKTTLFWMYVVLMLIPFQATIVPQYITLKTLKLLYTPLAVILPNIFSTFGTFLITQYMKGFDKQVLDAGKIDGLNEFGLLIRLVIPVCKPIFFALIILSFINYWSMIEQPLIFIEDNNYYPLSVLLNESSMFRTIAYACGVIFTILPMLLYLYCYDDLVNGIALTSSEANNIEQTNTGNSKNKIRQKRILKNMMLGFLIFMLICTVLTQKIVYIMTPKVTTVEPRTGTLSENPMSKESKDLGSFIYIVPQECVKNIGDKYVVYATTDDIYRKNKTIVIETKVEVLASNGYECAIEYHFPGKIVHLKSKDIYSGCSVIVMEEGEQND